MTETKLAATASAPKESIRLTWGLVALVALLCGFFVLIPAWTGPAGSAIGRESVDGEGSWWFQWWVAHALSRGVPISHTDMMFYPWGKNLLLDTGANMVDALIVLPIRALFGPLAAWNILCLGIMVSNGVAAGWWVMSSRGSRLAAMTATAIVTLHPFVLFELEEGRPTQALLAPAIVALLYGIRAIEEEDPVKGRRSALWAGLLLAFTGWVYWYCAGFVALALTVWAGTQTRWRTAVSRLTIMGLVSLLATAPAVIPILAAIVSDQVAGVLPVSEWMDGTIDFSTLSGDVVAIHTIDWQGRVGVLRQVVGDGDSAIGLGWEPLGVAMGPVVFLAALGAMWQRWRWGLVIGLVVAMGIGPFPVGIPNPVYIGVAQILPAMDRLYWPCRILVLLVPMAAVGLGYWVDRFPIRWRPLAGILLVLAAFVDLQVRQVMPLSTWDPKPLEEYACFADEEGAMIVLPYGWDHLHLVDQTVHHLPILGGMNERSRRLVPAEQRALKSDNGWIDALLTAPINPRASIAWEESAKEAVARLGYRWVVLRKEQLRGETSTPAKRQRERWGRMRLAEIAGKPVYEGDSISIYAPWGGDDPCANEPTASPTTSPDL